MANSRIMLTCRHCGGKTTLAKGDFGHYYAFEDASSALNEFFQKHMHGDCVNADCYSDNARDHFVILEKGEHISDVVEVKHGKWKQGIPYVCSICGKPAPDEKNTSGNYSCWLSPYCPHCGADMRGVKDE